MRKDHDRYMRLKYLKAVAGVQHQFKDWLSKTDQLLLVQGLRTEDLARQIKNTKRLDQMTTDWRRRNVGWISSAMSSLLSPHTVMISVGGEPSAEKRPEMHHIRVGWMWLHKVHKPLYAATDRRDYLNWLILSADKVSENLSFNFYQVKAYDPRKGKVIGGYVAQAKHTELKHSALGSTMAEAVEAAEELMSKDIDHALGIN